MFADKITLLGEGAKYDVCASCASTGQKIGKAKIGRTTPSGVCQQCRFSQLDAEMSKARTGAAFHCSRS